MKLLTKEIETLFAKTGSQENVKDPIVICKFFYPAGAGTWWATEMLYVIRRQKNVNENSRVYRVLREGGETRSAKMQNVCEPIDREDKSAKGSEGSKESNVQERNEDGQGICAPLQTGAPEGISRVCDAERLSDGEELGPLFEGQRNSPSQEPGKERRSDKEPGPDGETRSPSDAHEGIEFETLEVNASEMKKYKGWEILDVIFFGYVSIFGDECDEWGSFSLEELESFKGRFGLGIERDKCFEPKPMSKACPKACGLSAEESDDEGKTRLDSVGTGRKYDDSMGRDVR